MKHLPCILVLLLLFIAVLLGANAAVVSTSSPWEDFVATLSEAERTQLSQIIRTTRRHDNSNDVPFPYTADGTVPKVRY